MAQTRAAGVATEGHRMPLQQQQRPHMRGRVPLRMPERAPGATRHVPHKEQALEAGRFARRRRRDLTTPSRPPRRPALPSSHGLHATAQAPAAGRPTHRRGPSRCWQRATQRKQAGLLWQGALLARLPCPPWAARALREQAAPGGARSAHLRRPPRLPRAHLRRPLQPRERRPRITGLPWARAPCPDDPTECDLSCDAENTKRRCPRHAGAPTPAEGAGGSEAAGPATRAAG